MKKTDSISPFEKGETQTLEPRQCVTVRLPAEIVPHPLPGLSFTAFCRKGVGGVRPTQHAMTACGSPVLTLTPKKTIVIATLQGWEMSSLPTPSRKRCIIHQSNACKKARPDTQTDRQTDRQKGQREQHQTKHPRERRREKKNTRRGGNLGEGEEQGVRVELGVRGHEEETLGEPQTPHGVWVSPAPERERERERERRKREKRGRRTYQTAKERESGHKHQNKQGAGLKGHNAKQHFNPKDHETRTTNQLQTQETPYKNKHQANRVSGELSQQGGGAHGPPCAF